MRVLRTVETKYNIMPANLKKVEELIDQEEADANKKGAEISKLENTMENLER